MKRSDLYTFQEGLEMAQLKGRKFTYAVKKNKDLLKIEINAMEAELAEGFILFKKEREEMYKEHAEKDLEGKPKMKKIMVSATRSKWQYIILGMEDPKSEYGKAVAKLREKHADAIEAQEKAEEEDSKLLGEETEFAPYMIDLEVVPDDIHQSIMDRIIWMIRDIEKL